MIYKWLNRIGMIGDLKTKGGGEIAEVYGGIGESDPIYYKQREMVGTSPMQFKALGLPLKDYRIYGKTLKNGTPSPDMPVDVVGCGERTENLFDKNACYPQTNVFLNEYGDIASISGTNLWTISDYIWLERGNYYAYGLSAGGPGTYCCVYNPDKTFAWSVLNVANAPTAITINSGGYVRLSVRMVNNEINSAMLVPGTFVPQSYIPYGYKLPLTVNGTEYPIYLGQVETTRRIKKLVLTGEETSWGTLSSTYYIVAITNAFPWNWCVCTHCAYGDIINGNVNTQLWIKQSAFPDYPTLTDFKSFLAQQYANGTPVTIWYVLAEPETGIVNEPLHRIGDYADTVNFAQAGVTIPTFTGTNSITVDTPVKPSEIDLTGRLKTSGYGQLLDKNLTAINDSTGTPIFILG